MQNELVAELEGAEALLEALQSEVSVHTLISESASVRHSEWCYGMKTSAKVLRDENNGLEPVRVDARIPACTYYRGTLLIRNSAPLEPCSRTMPRALWWS